MKIGDVFDKIDFGVVINLIAIVILAGFGSLGYQGLMYLKKDDVDESKVKELSKVILEESFLWAEKKGVSERRSAHEYAICMSSIDASMLGRKVDCLDRINNKEFSQFITEYIDNSKYDKKVKDTFVYKKQ